MEQEGLDRPEELIAEAYRQLREIRERGGRPAAVVMNAENYRSIQRYHATLGETPAPAFDYIDRYSLYGLSILVDPGEKIRVLEEGSEPG